MVKKLILSSLFFIIVYLPNKIVFAEESTVGVVLEKGVDNSTFEENISSNQPTVGTFFVKGVSDFKFGAVKIGEESSIEFVGETSEKNKIDTSGIEIVDLRGSGSGWQVNVYLEPITLMEDGRNLNGFELVIPSEEVTTKSSSTTKKPNSKLVTLTGYGPETAQKIFYAERGKGMGKYTNIFQRKNTVGTKVSLKVPKTAKKGNYSGHLVWSLIDGPTS